MTGHLPQLEGAALLTDSGLETDLIFHHDVDLPAFAAFTLLRDDRGRELLAGYAREHFETAAAHGFGAVVETPTWRASRDWAGAVGWSTSDVVRSNRDAVELVCDIRRSVKGAGPQLVSGNLGPRSDGYVSAERMTAAEALGYHGEQVEAFASTDVDLVTLMTVAYPPEAIGFVRAATENGLAPVVSFTVETDGRLPDGTELGDAIAQVEDATDGAAAYFMVNCAHPTHFRSVLDPHAPWAERLVGLRANASTRSHAELDEADDLDDGDPILLATELVDASSVMPAVRVLGGCCGTDVRHIDAVGAALRASSQG